MSLQIQRQLIKLREVNIDARHNMAANTWITGICSLLNGDVIMADNNNRRVLVFAMNYEYLNSTQLSDSPWDVDSIDKSRFVASMAESSNSNQIHIFQLSPSSEPEIHFTIRLPFTCHGITYVNNSLIITCLNDASVKLMDMKGNVKWSVTALPRVTQPFFKRPLYVRAQLDGLTFVVTDEKMNTISVLSYTGKILNSKCVRNGNPLGVTVNVDGGIFVCLKENNTVIELCETLTKERTRGTQKRGLVLPQAICYHPLTDQYIVSSTQSGTINIYEMM